MLILRMHRSGKSKNVFRGSEFQKSEVALEQSPSLAGRTTAQRWCLTSLKALQEQNQDQIPTAPTSSPTKMIRSRCRRVMDHLGDLTPEMPQGLLATRMYGVGTRLASILGLACMVT